MLTQLATLKERLGILAGDTQYDALLTRAIEAVSARFERECNRVFTRTVGFTQEFPATEMEIVASCYPVESVSKFELKTSEAEGWAEQTGIGYLLRQACVISLAAPLVVLPRVSIGSAGLGRVTYTGGYVMPGATPGAGQVPLPADLEQAAIEQVAAWFYNREKLGLIRYWPDVGTYVVLSQLPLLPEVAAMIRPYRRWSV
jgi:hypothetical protein